MKVREPGAAVFTGADRAIFIECAREPQPRADQQTVMLTRG